MIKPILAVATALVLLAPVGAVAKQPDNPGSQGASKECRAERSAMGSENFAAKYGSNKNRKNAFGKCVARTEKEQAQEAEDATKNAAKSCKAEREADPAAFQTKYGSNKNGKNAFGKCVSEKADEQQDEADAEDAEELNAERECRKEQEADPEAFRSAHGTNKNGENAFGKCVSERVHQDG